MLAAQVRLCRELGMTLYELQTRMTYSELLIHIAYECLQQEEIKASQGKTEVKAKPEDLDKIMQGFFPRAKERKRQ